MQVRRFRSIQNPSVTSICTKNMWIDLRFCHSVSAPVGAWPGKRRAHGPGAHGRRVGGRQEGEGKIIPRGSATPAATSAHPRESSAPKFSNYDVPMSRQCFKTSANSLASSGCEHPYPPRPPLIPLPAARSRAVGSSSFSVCRPGSR